MGFGERSPTPERPVALGRYELLERIGQGGMAEVFRARLTGPAGFAKDVVIKRILPRLAEDPLVVRMFVEEAKIAAAVHHDNIAQVYELVETADGSYFMVMEYIRGLDLEILLQMAARFAFKVPPWFAVHVVIEVLEALSHVHGLTDEAGRPRNVIHRDATPSNIFVSKLGRVKLTDFGVADFAGKSPTTLAGQLKGKLAYMSPEQLQSELLDQRSDIFTLGIVLWETLTQTRLFGGKSEVQAMLAICEGQRQPPSALVPGLPPELDACVLRALAADREARFGSAEAFQAELLAILPRLHASVRPAHVRAVLRALQQEEARRDAQHLDTSSFSRMPTRDGAEPDDLPPDARPTPASGLDATLLRKSAAELAADPSAADPFAADPPAADPSAAYPAADPFATEDAAADPAMALEVKDLRALLAARWGAEPADARALIVEGDPTVPFDRAELGLDPVILGGPEAYWVRRGRAPAGPMGWQAAMEALRSEAAAGRATELSTDGVTWLGGRELARLVGIDFGVELDLPSNVTVVGRLEEQGLAAVLGGLARDRATGTLAIARTDQPLPEWYELSVFRGRLVRARSNVARMQLPDVLLRGGHLEEGELPELLRRVLREKKGILQLAAERGRPLPSASALLAERLVELFRWRAADYTFNAELEAGHRPPPQSQPLLALLPELLARTHPLERLIVSLAGQLEQPWSPTSRFEAGLSELELPPERRAHAHALAQGRTLRQLLDGQPTRQLEILVHGFLLRETGLLAPRG